MSKRLYIHEDVHDRLTALSQKYNCSVSRVLVELASLGELLSETSRLEIHCPDQPGNLVRVWVPGTGRLWPDWEQQP